VSPAQALFRNFAGFHIDFVDNFDAGSGFLSAVDGFRARRLGVNRAPDNVT